MPSGGVTSVTLGKLGVSYSVDQAVAKVLVTVTHDTGDSRGSYDNLIIMIHSDEQNT